MFSSNNIVSKWQIYKSYFCYSLAPTLFVMLYDYESPTERFIYILTAFFIAFCISFILPPDSDKNFCIVSLLSALRSLLIFSLSIYLIYFLILNVFFIRLDPIIYIFLCFISFLFFKIKSIEILHRVSEILFYIILIPMFFLIFTRFSFINASNATSLINRISTSISTKAASINPIKPSTIIIYSLMLTPLELPEIKCPKKTHYFILSLTTLFIITCFSLFLSSTIFVNTSKKYTLHPLLSLMQLSNFKNSFSGRSEGIVSIFLLFSLTYSASYHLHFSLQKLPDLKKRCHLGFTCLLSKPATKVLFVISILATMLIIFAPCSKLFDASNKYLKTYSPSIKKTMTTIHINADGSPRETLNEKNDYSHLEKIILPKSLSNKSYNEQLKKHLAKLLLPYKLNPKYYENIVIAAFDNSFSTHLYELYN